MSKSSINVLFVCGMGMGTSTMAELGVKRELKPLKISAEVDHTSLGMMASRREWADIIVILRNLFTEVVPQEGEFFIPVVNVMASKDIAAQINEIVVEHFPGAKES
ncbi:MAG: PTS sugar transporter subunit IIB [Saccharofermentanales bacterium]|jgi:PTS system ascorbate-specific IIB component